MIRRSRWAAWSGLIALQGLVARTYYVRGTWWHYLLHVPIGLGVGLAGGVLVSLWRRQPALPWMLAGQLLSIIPDLMFRFMRMPHDASMDWYVGHISVHRGPSPVLVALGVLLLGGWAWLAVPRRVVSSALALSAGAVLLVACLLASPLPSRLADL